MAFSNYFAPRSPEKGFPSLLFLLFFLLLLNMSIPGINGGLKDLLTTKVNKPSKASKPTKPTRWPLGLHAAKAAKISKPSKAANPSKGKKQGKVVKPSKATKASKEEKPSKGKKLTKAAKEAKVAKEAQMAKFSKAITNLIASAKISSPVAKATTTKKDIETADAKEEEEEKNTKIKDKKINDDADDRVDYVKKILCDRYSYVNRGKRQADILCWVQEQGGEAKVFSMHGVDVNFKPEDLQKLDAGDPLEPTVLTTAATTTVTSEEKETTSKQTVTKKGFFRRDPFLPDRLNLNLPSVTLTEGASDKRFHKSTIEKPPSVIQLSFRAVKLSFCFAPVWTTAWLAALNEPFRRGVWYPWFSSCLASSGAAFIKWGQWAATRADMFPRALCDALSDLHNSAPGHSWRFTQVQVEESLGIPRGRLLDVFQSFEKEPIASGSIAQVHKACLFNGELIAAKVRHPRVAQLIDMDFRLMSMMASIVDSIPALKWVHLKDSVVQFSHTMAAQAHLNVEAHHLEVLNHNFRKWNHVSFPRPFYASPSVILESFENGQIVTRVIDEFEAVANSLEPPMKGYDIIPVGMIKFVVANGVSLYLKMLLLDNLMHADLHPGNIMIDITDRRGKRGRTISEQSSYSITLVDAGMVAQLTDYESSTFIGLLACLVEGDGKAAAAFILRFSVENNFTGDERQAFEDDVLALFDEKCRGYGTDVDVSDVLRDILSLVQKHHVRIDANFATLIINVMCVESLGKNLCPDYNVLDAGTPLLQAYSRFCFESDGITPVEDTSRLKQMKKLLPILLYGKKKKDDDKFFKKIKESRTQTMIPSTVISK